jgi:putative transposase
MLTHVDAAYRFRFYPTPGQVDLLNRTFGCVRVVYNRARTMREVAWVERKERLGFTQTNAMLTALKKDPEFAWLNEVSSVPLQQALRHLDTAYRNFFRKTARYPGFRKKDGPQSAEFTKSGFTYRDGRLKLAKMDEPLNVVWSRELPGAPTTVTVTREADGRWYISCRVVAAVETLSGGGAVGIDLGLKHLATLSTGEKIENPRHMRKRQKRVALLQRRLAKKQKGSKNRAKAKLKAARAHAAVRHARSDFLHKLSTRLIRENQTICVETLSVKGMLRAKLHSKSISDAGWGELVRMLSYKAAWYGRKLIKIDRFHPSTKTCNDCGATGHALTLGDREWTCPDCGAAHDRDINAARNILAAGLAVSACGGDVSPGVLRHSGQSPVKQEPDSRVSVIPAL